MMCVVCVLVCNPLSAQALCVCPTRELVVQNQMVLERMGKFTGGLWVGDRGGWWALCG